MMELTLVKLGGSLITDKGQAYTVRDEVVERLAREIREARQQRPLALVVGHGGGSFPHVSAASYQTDRGIVNERSWEGFVRVHNDAARLNAIVCQALERAGLLAMPLQPSAAAVAHEGRIVEWPMAPVRAMLAGGIIPVPYGDVCVDGATGCCIVSTEEILRFFARELRPERVLLVGKVDGVLDTDGAVIPRIDRSVLDSLTGTSLASDGLADVTGGMRHKLARAIEMGVPVEIINGLVPGVLRDTLLGARGKGTIVFDSQAALA